MGYDINSINKYADDLLAKIDACIAERIKNTPQLVSAIVSKVNEDGTVNVYFPPNEKSVFTRIQNQSIYDLQVGDSVEIVLKDGTYSNCWILAKHGVNQAKRISEGSGSGTNTIIIGGGSSGGGGDGSVVTSGAVRYDISQLLTTVQQGQARANIGAGTSNFDGNYNNLINKPTIPTATSQLTNDSDFATNSSVSSSVNSMATTLRAEDTELKNLLVEMINLRYSADNPPPYPVTSVDGATGAVQLNDVKFVAQTLTDEQKTQARTNIGAGTGDGDYNNLINKPTIPTTVNQLTDSAEYAKLNSPAFTGTPTAPNTDLSSNDTTIANTKFVQDLVANVTGGSVSGPESAEDNNVVVFNGTTGKLIKDSGKTLGVSVPADAKFTDTTYTPATSTSDGLLSKEDKVRYDSLVAVSVSSDTPTNQQTGDLWFKIV